MMMTQLRLTQIPIAILTNAFDNVNKYIQLSTSSLAIHGGAIFSAVSGRKSIPISVPRPYECPECSRLLGFGDIFLQIHLK